MAYQNGVPSVKVPDLRDQFIKRGRLHLKAQIGCGAWGVIYQGEYMSEPGRYWAVKCTMKDGFSQCQRDSIAHEVEMHIECAKASPLILPIVDVFEEEVVDEDEKRAIKVQFIVTEYCEDGDLSRRIHKENAAEVPRDDERIRSLFVQILDAVAACHEKGIYHRDLKPDNILLRDGGRRIALADFGFATKVKESRDFGLGSAPFMSPETFVNFHRVCRSEEPIISSPHADIWALGVILLNLITGCVPWLSADLYDYHFARYINDEPDHLYNTFEISRGAHEILRSIFTLDLRRRINVEDLRSTVLSVKTFMRAPQPRVVVNTQRHTSYSQPNAPTGVAAPTDRSCISAQLEAAMLDLVNSVGPGEAGIAGGSIIDSFPAPPEGPDMPNCMNKEDDSLKVVMSTESASPLLNETDIADRIFIIDHDSDSDADESEGPITPETQAVDKAAIALAGGAKTLDHIPELDLVGAAAFTSIYDGAARVKPATQFVVSLPVFRTRDDEIAVGRSRV